MLYWDEPLTPTLGEGRRPSTPRTPSYNAARTSSPTHGACPDEQVKEPESVLSGAPSGSMVSLETGSNQNDTWAPLS